MLPPLPPREGGAATPGTAQTPLGVLDPGAAAAGFLAGATPQPTSAPTDERSAADTPASEGSVHGQVMPREPALGLLLRVPSRLACVLVRVDLCNGLISAFCLAGRCASSCCEPAECASWRRVWPWCSSLCELVCPMDCMPPGARQRRFGSASDAAGCGAGGRADAHAAVCQRAAAEPSAGDWSQA